MNIQKEEISRSAYFQKWKRDNPDKVNAYRKKYVLVHGDRIKANKKKWLAVPENREKMREYSRKRRNTPRGKFDKYKCNAKKRGYEFNLSFEEFFSLISSVCVYCGSDKKIGVDRVKNSIGYIKTNCVSCCWPCNRAKRTFSGETFLKVCIAVAKFQSKL